MYTSQIKLLKFQAEVKYITISLSALLLEIEELIILEEQ